MNGRQYVKLCNREDFDDPDLRAMLREMVPGLGPEEELHRKYWEYAMLGLYLDNAGALSDDAEALALAAGQEQPLYWLANRIRRVVATDIYGEGRFSSREATASMLDDPRRYAPFPYREDHLEVRHMNALAVDYPDESFNIVFCLSSIEHFGGPEAATRSAREMARVLRPGGHLVITTECFIGRNPLNSPKLQYAIRLATGGRRCSAATPTKRMIDAFTPGEIERQIIEPVGQLGAALSQPLDLTFSPKSRDNLIHWVGAGELHPATGSPFPHIVMQAHGSPWTSAFLAFKKRS